jgi:hypothetical protein
VRDVIATRICVTDTQRHAPVVWPQAQRNVIKLDSGGVVASELRRERKSDKRGG